MAYDFSNFKKKSSEIKEWLKRELSLLRTGRASPNLLDNISVDYYGNKTLLKHVGVISIEDARTLRVKPWDASLIRNVEQEIRNSGLGIQAIVDKDSIRVVFPELTQERRKSLLKILSEKLEEARISIRQEREEYWRDIQDKEREGKISEDDKFRNKDELQKLVDEAVKELEKTAKNKEEEIEN